MKRIALIMIASAFAVVGGSHAVAQQVPTPELCAEADTAPPECADVIGGVYPPAVLPPTVPPTTVPPTTDPPTTPTTTIVAVAPPVPPTVLADTGASGTTGLLQLGALLITGGALVLVAARRRSPANSTAT